MSADDAIGGYFPLAIPDKVGRLRDGVIGFQSARAAFLALLRHVKPPRVWLPRYLCPAMLRAVQSADCEARLYSLTPSFEVEKVNTGAGDLVLAVDYFGLAGISVEEPGAGIHEEQFVIDAAQAIFTRSEHAIATLYSPRKFLGLPDGGWLETALPVPSSDLEDDGSPQRCVGPLLRMDGRVEEGYTAYQTGERSLDDMEPKRTSRLTEALESRIDWSDIKAKRRANYTRLAAKLEDAGKTLPLGDGAPLCFALIGVDALRLRPLLAAQRIYTPTYWPDIIDADNLNAFELTLRDRTLYLPIDQRYGPADMERLASIVRRVVQS